MRIIRLSIISLLILSSLNAASCGSCLGCSLFWDKLVEAAETINNRHKDLEEKLNDYYLKNIIPLQIQTDLLQLEITKLTAKIEALEKEAFIDTRKLEKILSQAGIDTRLQAGDNNDK